MKKAIYPGTFDPITLGHLDVIERASKVVDQLEVVIMQNPTKNSGVFSVEERIEMIKKATEQFDNVSVSAQSGLTVEYAKKVGAQALVRGLRAVMDYEFEFQQATANKILEPEIETVFFMTHTKYSFLSSSVVKQVAVNKGDLSSFVPEKIKSMIEKKYGY